MPVVFADVDGDGHPDLIIGNYFQDGGHILDATASGIEVMHNTKSRSFNGGSKHVLLWKKGAAAIIPSRVIEEVKNVFPPEVERGWTLGAGAADLDGDLFRNFILLMTSAPTVYCTTYQRRATSHSLCSKGIAASPRRPPAYSDTTHSKAWAWISLT